MISSCIVIPTYCESLALPELINSLKLEVNSNVAVIVCDDSPFGERELIKKYISELNEQLSRICIYISEGNLKAGRGSAVKRGLSLGLDLFRNCQIFIECDADGSHSSQDILRLAGIKEKKDFIIGSRYLQGSSIIDWPISRVIFSRLLNLSLPNWFRLSISDITNGLRRYSRESATVICRETNVVSGFLYLTEQLLILKKNQLTNWAEIPIQFQDRTKGNSSVTTTDLFKSIKDVFLISKEYKFK